MSEGSGFLLSQDGFRYIRGLLTLLLNIILAATCDARGCGDPSSGHCLWVELHHSTSCDCLQEHILA